MRRAHILLYVLAAYIVLQVSWWGYSLYRLHCQLAEGMTDIADNERNQLMKKKIWMVAGEGGVFLLLILLGFWYVHRTINREWRLARMEQTFLLSVTHELKTPVAAIRLFLETIKSRQLTTEQLKQTTAGALKETDRLQTLSENILLATRFDHGNSTLMNENVSLSELLQGLATKAQAQTGRNVILKNTKDIQVKGDKELLRTMFANLLENALKYSPEETDVIVDMDINDDEVCISIIDKGIGIAQKERRSVFNKFYRGGDESVRKHKGTGLGLYIVQNIVFMHNGKIDIAENPSGGTIFTVRLKYASK